MPFFSNLLPRSHLAKYLAEQCGVKFPNVNSIYFGHLAVTCPGAITINPFRGEAWPPDACRGLSRQPWIITAKTALAPSRWQVFSEVFIRDGSKRGLTIPPLAVGGPSDRQSFPLRISQWSPEI